MHLLYETKSVPSRDARHLDSSRTLCSFKQGSTSKGWSFISLYQKPEELSVVAKQRREPTSFARPGRQNPECWTVDVALYEGLAPPVKLWTPGSCLDIDGHPQKLSITLEQWQGV